MAGSLSLEEIVLPLVGDASSYVSSLSSAKTANLEFAATMEKVGDLAYDMWDAWNSLDPAQQTQVITWLTTTNAGAIVLRASFVALGSYLAVTAVMELSGYNDAVEYLNKSLEESKRLTEENIKTSKDYAEILAERARGEKDPLEKQKAYQEGIARLQKEYADAMRNHEDEVKKARAIVASGDSYFGIVSENAYNEAKTTIENYEKLMGGKSEALQKLRAEMAQFESENAGEIEKRKSELDYAKVADPNITSVEQMKEQAKMLDQAQQEIETFGKSKLEKKLYDLAGRDDLTPLAKERLEIKYRELDALEKEAELREENKKYQEDWEKESERRLNGLLSDLDRTAKEKQRERDQLVKEGERVAESVATPFEAAQSELERLNSLYEENVISCETYARSVEKLVGEYKNLNNVKLDTKFDAQEATTENIAKRIEQQKTMLELKNTQQIGVYDPKAASDRMIELLGQIKDGVDKQFRIEGAGL